MTDSPVSRGKFRTQDGVPSLPPPFRLKLQDFVAMGRSSMLGSKWTLLQTVPCLANCGGLDSLAGWHGNDFCTEGVPGAPDEVDEMILASFNEGAPTSGFGSEHGGHHLEASPSVVSRRRSQGSGCEACGKSGKSP